MNIYDENQTESLILNDTKDLDNFFKFHNLEQRLKEINSKWRNVNDLTNFEDLGNNLLFKFQQFKKIFIDFDNCDYIFYEFLNSMLAYILSKNNYFLSEISIKGYNLNKFVTFIKNIGDVKILNLGSRISEKFFDILFLDNDNSFKNLEEFTMSESISNKNFIKILKNAKEKISILNVNFKRDENYNLVEYKNLKKLNICCDMNQFHSNYLNNLEFYEFNLIEELIINLYNIKNIDSITSNFLIEEKSKCFPLIDKFYLNLKAFYEIKKSGNNIGIFNPFFNNRPIGVFYESSYDNRQFSSFSEPECNYQESGNNERQKNYFLQLECKKGEIINNLIQENEKSLYSRINTIKLNEHLNEKEHQLLDFINLKSLSLIYMKIDEKLVEKITKMQLVELILINVYLDKIYLNNTNLLWIDIISLNSLKYFEINFEESQITKEHILNFLCNHLQNSKIERIILKNFNFEIFSYEINLVKDKVNKSNVKEIEISANESKLKILKNEFFGCKKKIVVLKAIPNQYSQYRNNNNLISSNQF